MRPGLRIAMASVAIISFTGWLVGSASARPAGADTDPSSLDGQGGSFLQPVLTKLISDDGSNLAPLFAAYQQTDINSGIAAFVGSGPGQFSADFAVSERPLTQAESSQAASDGRSYAYVPFASTPVALATLVPTQAWELTSSTSINSSDFCRGIPLSTALLGAIFGVDADPITNWSDARITCPGGASAASFPMAPYANLDPSMANYGLMALLDSTPQSQADFAAGLQAGGSLTTSTTPSTNWPYAANTIPGGDQPLLGKLLGINAETNLPSTSAGTWALGAIAPISSVWTGAPLGVPWNVPTAAVQNEQGSYVAPSLASAQAAANDATVASTSDPTTNDLVTFNASATDAAAYNNYLMTESYLVVPLNGLPAAKANALAQFIRFIVGSDGQQDMAPFGVASATPAMQTADLKVAAELNAEAVSSANPTASTSGASTSTTGASATSASVSNSAGAGDSAATGADSTTAATSGGGLAFTGMSHIGTLVAVGLTMVVFGSVFRRRLRRRKARW